MSSQGGGAEHQAYYPALFAIFAAPGLVGNVVPRPGELLGARTFLWDASDRIVGCEFRRRRVRQEVMGGKRSAEAE